MAFLKLSGGDAPSPTGFQVERVPITSGERRSASGRAVVDYVGVKSDRPPYALIGVEGSEPKDDVPFMFKPFGCGCQDAKAVVDAAIEAGAGWVIVEQDESPERAPLEAAKISLDNVKNCL